MKEGMLNLYSSIPLIMSFTLKNSDLQTKLVGGAITLVGVIISIYKPFLKIKK